MAGELIFMRRAKQRSRIELIPSWLVQWRKVLRRHPSSQQAPAGGEEGQDLDVRAEAFIIDTSLAAGRYRR